MDGNGDPLAVTVGGANRHDSIFLASLFDAHVIKQPKEIINNLCLDAGYTGKERDVWERDMIPHIRPRGEEKTFSEIKPLFKPRRWVVEASHSWLNRFRKLIPRYEKTDRSYLAFIALASTMVALNKCTTIYG